MMNKADEHRVAGYKDGLSGVAECPYPDEPECAMARSWWREGWLAAQTHMAPVAPPLRYFRMFPDVKSPTRATAGSACYDLRAYITPAVQVNCWDARNNGTTLGLCVADGVFSVVMPPRSRALIPTGLILQLDPGWSCRAHPRSGLSVKQGLSLSNCEGVIDSDYREELKVTLINHSDSPAQIEHDVRLTQMELYRDQPSELVEIFERPAHVTERVGGFGHSGVK